MNSKDFVVVPWGKPGHSVKLKYKHAQELRMEKVHLELENQEMEKKLQEFKSTWNKEKEEIKSDGYHWKSGRVGKLGNPSHIMSQNKGNAIKISPGKVKLKLLKAQRQEPTKQSVNDAIANSRENKNLKIKGKVCGQCEKKAALLVCLECGEDYCSGCFAKIHQKGALRLHRTTLLQRVHLEDCGSCIVEAAVSRKGGDSVSGHDDPTYGSNNLSGPSSAKFPEPCWVYYESTSMMGSSEPLAVCIGSNRTSENSKSSPPEVYLSSYGIWNPEGPLGSLAYQLVKECSENRAFPRCACLETCTLKEKSQIISSVLDVAHRFIKEVNPDDSKAGTSTRKESNKSQRKPKSVLLQGSSSEVEMTTKVGECTSSRDGLLCEGSLDEAASARSVQEAVIQWRAGGAQEDSKKQSCPSAKPDSMEECEVQTNMKIWSEPVNIEFTEDSLSYMEKLWLKKHRRTIQEQPDTFLHLPAALATTTTTGEVQASQNESGDGSDEEIKVKSPPLFMPVEELNMERPEPSLTITEMDDTYEDECEETGKIVPYKVELADSKSQLSDIYQHHVFHKRRLDLSPLCLTSSPAYDNDGLNAETSNTDCDNLVDSDIDSPDNEKVRENSFSEGNLEEQNINPESIKKTDDSCISFGSKNSLPTTNLDTIFSNEIFSQNTQGSLEFTNLPEKPCPNDSKTIESSLLLQEIALRNKPVNKQYQGPERFLSFHENENLNLVLSQSLESSCSPSRMTLAGDRECTPAYSVGGHAVHTAAFDVLKSVENPPPQVQQQKIGKKSQRPSTANLPLSNSVKKDSSCLPSPHRRSRSAAAQSLSRAASEISEIEYIDSTDQHVPSSDQYADQQALDILEKELNVMRNLTDSSGKLSSLSTEELSDFKHNWLNMSQISSDFPITSHVMGPHGPEKLSSSGKDAGLCSLLSLSDYSTDEDEENFLDKQQVRTLPWSKGI